MPLKEGYCIIVDGYSTGKTIASLLKNDPDDSYACIHIKSSAELPAGFQHDPADYAMSFNYEGGTFTAFVEQIRTALQAKPVHFIIAGSESGVELADQLNAQFTLPGNDPAKSFLRRDKFAMNEAAKHAGINTVKQCKSAKVTDIHQWAALLTAESWPIVLKPLSSQSADHVYFCQTRDDITHAFIEISDAIDMFGHTNDEVLAQSFNDGQEYIVNTVSYAGQHWLAELWRIHKRPQTTIYEYAELIDHTAAEFQALKAAAFTMLDIVGTRYGAGTTEFKYTPQKGPVLLETTSRPMGGAPLAFTKEILGYTQVSVMLEALLKPECFMTRLVTATIPCAKSGMVVVLIADVKGKLRESIEEVFSGLETFRGMKMLGKAGDPIDVTIDSLTTPGEIYLVGEVAKIFATYAQIRALELAGLYRHAVVTHSVTNSAVPGDVSLPPLSALQSTTLSNPVNLEAVVQLNTTSTPAI